MYIERIEKDNYEYITGMENSYGVVKKIKKKISPENTIWYDVVFDKALIEVHNVDCVVFVDDDFKF